MLANLKLALDEFNKQLKHADPSNYEDHIRCDIYRGNLTQCLEYTTEGLWKYLKTYLLSQGFTLTEFSPRHVIRMSAFAKIITEPEAIGLIRMIEERNKTSHIYREEIANAFAAYAPEALALMQTIVGRLEQNKR
jgi:hypothetical protein